MATAFTRAKREIMKRTAAADRLKRPHGSRFWDEKPKGEQRAELAELCQGVEIKRLPPGRPVVSEGKAGRRATRACYGDGRRRGPVLREAILESL